MLMERNWKVFLASSKPRKKVPAYRESVVLLIADPIEWTLKTMMEQEKFLLMEKDLSNVLYGASIDLKSFYTMVKMKKTNWEEFTVIVNGAELKIQFTMLMIM